MRGVKVTEHHVKLFSFAVHSFLRPTEKELFGVRHCDIENKSNAPHLVIKVHGGKTGFRISATLALAVLLYQGMKNPFEAIDPNEYVFMPEYKNRSTAVSTARRIFNHFLEVAQLKYDTNGNSRSRYSLRHFALQSRLRNSKGKVNIYWLAKNAGTSVEQLERFYLKNMDLSAEQVENLQTLGDV